MRRALLLLMLAGAIALSAYGQACTVTAPATCPTTGSPAGWTGPPNIYGGSITGPPAQTGQTYQAFLSGAGTSYAAIISGNSPAPINTILYSANLFSLGQQFILSDAVTCGGASAAPTCLYNNAGYAKKVIDAFLKPLPVGVGLGGIDINPDVGPMMLDSHYAAICAAYAISSGHPSCFTPSTTLPTVPNSYFNQLTNTLYTYNQALPYIKSTYPGTQIHLSPTFSPAVLNACGLLTVANRTESAMESCLVPMYATWVAANSTDRFDMAHEITGIFGLLCGACPFLSTTANVDLFLQHAATAIKANSVNASIKVGVGGVIPDMGTAPWTCPSATNFWCDYVTLDPFLDYVGMDIYPSSTSLTSQYATLIGTPGGTTFTYSLPIVKAQTLPLVAVTPYHLDTYANESSGLRWVPSAGGTGGVEQSTFIGAGWQGWLDNGAIGGWITAVPGTWAQNIGLKGYSMFVSPPLIYLSTDSNNTRAIYGSDTYMSVLMAALPVANVSGAGLLYGGLNQAALTSAVTITGAVSTSGRVTIGH